MKSNMIDHIRRMYTQRIDRYGPDHAGYPPAEKILDPNVLTIGFARRFAPYKRSLLFFSDLERLKKIMGDKK